MHLRFLAASLLMGAVILFVPATTAGVPIHVHKKVPVEREVVLHELVRGDPVVATGRIEAKKTVVDVVHVAPKDDDDDGYANAEDNCPSSSYTGNGGCPPPPPPESVYAETSSAGTGGYSGTGLTDAAVSGYAGAGGSTVQCESGGDYSAVDSTGTYWGGWQFDQQTWDAYAPSGEWGSATPAEQDAAAAAVPYDAWPNC